MYQIFYKKTVISKDIPVLSQRDKLNIKRTIEEKLTIDPIRFGLPLRHTLKGYRRLRIGNYRVVYKIESNTVIILAIKHRKNIYKKLN